MTLRVRISIVPFGDEEKEREIEVINISNVSDRSDPITRQYYQVEHNKYKSGEPDGKLFHNRDDGALKLATLALELLNKGE